MGYRAQIYLFSRQPTIFFRIQGRLMGQSGTPATAGVGVAIGWQWRGMYDQWTVGVAILGAGGGGEQIRWQASR